MLSSKYQKNSMIFHKTKEELLKELPECIKEECVICLYEFKNGDKFISLPCIHIFHAYCIKNWLKKQKNCPICKYEINIRE